MLMICPPVRYSPQGGIPFFTLPAVTIAMNSPKPRQNLVRLPAYAPNLETPSAFTPWQETQNLKYSFAPALIASGSPENGFADSIFTVEVSWATAR